MRYDSKKLRFIFNVTSMTKSEAKESRKALKKMAADIEYDAKIYMEERPALKGELDGMSKVAREELRRLEFKYIAKYPLKKFDQELKEAYAVLNALYLKFLSAVNSNEYLVVSYIFNYCVTDRITRAILGNMPNVKDENNRALHYAAKYKANDVLCVLLDERKIFAGEKSRSSKYPKLRFSFENASGFKPFHFALKNGDLTTFCLFWYGRNLGKSSHNSEEYLKSALGSSEMIALMRKHSEAGFFEKKRKKENDSKEAEQGLPVSKRRKLK